MTSLYPGVLITFTILLLFTWNIVISSIGFSYYSWFSFRVTLIYKIYFNIWTLHDTLAVEHEIRLERLDSSSIMRLYPSKRSHYSFFEQTFECIQNILSHVNNIGFYMYCTYTYISSLVLLILFLTIGGMIHHECTISYRNAIS